KKRAGGQRVSGSLRSRADSNRCTSFCRALPSHSATRPVDASKSVSLDEAQNYKIRLFKKRKVACGTTFPNRFQLLFGLGFLRIGFTATRHLLLQSTQCLDIAQCRLFSLLVDVLNGLAFASA